MTEEFFEDANRGEAELKETGKETPENNYERYNKELGGIINEQDYQGALDRMDGAKELKEDNPRIIQALNIARIAEIDLIGLNNAEKARDPKVLLYATLRGDVGPKDNRNHHSQMSDQRLFGEALKMLGDTVSLKKLVEKLPHIFNWPSDKIG